MVDGVCLESGCDLLQILKQGLYFFGKKEDQKRLDAFLQDHAHQPLDVVACGAQHRMNGISSLAFEVAAMKPVVLLQVPNNWLNGLAPACKLALFFGH